jgi:hypothetical protein
MMRPQQQQQTLHGGGGNMYIGGPGGIVQHQHRMAGTYVAPGGRNNQRPPNVSIGPDGINIGGRGGGAEWRHVLMSQQQNAVFGTQMRPTFTQGGHQGKTSQRFSPFFNSLHTEQGAKIVKAHHHFFFKERFLSLKN